MKTTEEIEEEIKFQESEYDRLRKLVESGISDDKAQMYRETMSRHAARRQALKWVIDA